jgi:hypothetical protein
MKIKKSILIIFIATAVFAVIPACKKYPEGPAFSLRTRTERVANTWRVDNYKVNGTDYTSLVSGYTETYTKSGAYSYSWGNLFETGRWAFANDDREIQITGTDNQSDHTLIILKLEEKQFWYYYMDGGDKKEFHMVQN